MNIGKHLFCLFILSANLFAASLEVTKDSQLFIDSTTKKNDTKQIDLTDSKLKKSDRIHGQQIAYEVIKREKDEKILKKIKSLFSEKEANIGYGQKKGMYFYENTKKKKVALKNSSSDHLTTLKDKAFKTMKDLMDQDADNYVFANVENHWIKTSDDEKEFMSGITFRFTRKINGRHILDNTAYTRITFYGNDEVADFEIVNPILKPIKLKRFVKSGHSLSRLETYAKNKKTFIKNKSKKINVSTIKALYGIDSYYSQKLGDQKVLLPYESFFSELFLENGDKHQNWINLCLDAENSESLDESMIETTIQR
ncbi:hypothetical protein JW935_00960 [candidate division KSB1 bacterium]|nr:hypothetical protein [candidate division KSB1 bacterium]